MAASRAPRNKIRGYSCTALGLRARVRFVRHRAGSAPAAPSSPPRRCGRSSASAIRRSRRTARLAVVPRHHLRHRGEQGSHRSVAGAGRRRRRAPAHQRQGQRHAAHGEPGRQVDRVRLQARRRHRDPGLRDRGRRRRSAPRDQPAHRRVGAEVVSGQQAPRVRERGVAGSRALGRPGRAQEGARGLEDDGAGVDQGADLVLRSYLDDREPHLFSIAIEGGETDRDHAHVGLPPLEAEVDASSYDISPDGLEVAFAAERRQERHREQLRRHPAADLRLQAAARHLRRTARPTTARRATARTAAASRSRSSASTGSTPIARGS